MGRVLTIGDILKCYQRGLADGLLPVEAAERTAKVLPISAAGVLETVGEHHLTVMRCQQEAQDRQTFTFAWLRMNPGWHSDRTVAQVVGGPNKEWRLRWARMALAVLAGKGLVEYNCKASYRAKVEEGEQP